MDLEKPARHSDSSTSKLQDVKYNEIETMQRPRSGAGPLPSLIAYLLGDDVRRTRTFFALSDLKLDLLTFIESGVA